VEAQLARVARALDRHGELAVDAPRPAAEHHDAIAEHDRLVDVVRDEHRGQLRMLRP
jgi:hypothetical protein